MQLSQLYRRGVIRPLNHEAAEELASFWISKPIRTEWLAVQGDSQFAAIWKSGVFQLINESCGSEISDYEEAELVADDLSKALDAIDGFVPPNIEVAMFLNALRSLLYDARECRQNVYFVF